MPTVIQRCRLVALSATLLAAASGSLPARAQGDVPPDTP